jgi:sarcosine oxidase
MQRFDTIVVGLGATGSAALCHLARKGRRVLGIDRHSPPHALGSSHGDTRITRLAIGEGAQYTPLAQRSHALWRELEAATGTSLLTTNGGLIVSSGATDAVMHVPNFFANTIAAAAEFGIAHELLTAAEIRRRWPQLKVADRETGYYERDAGFLRPEACVRAHLALAARHGAEIARDERALAFDAADSGVVVTTDRAAYAADKLVVAAGPWLPGLVPPDLARHFRVCRQTLFWFAIDGPVAPFLPENFPVFIWEASGSPQGIYGFPAVDGADGGMKIATEQFAATTTPETVDRTVGDAEVAAMHEHHVAPNFRGVSRRCLRATACLYTVTPDFGFVIDRHPASDRVIVASPCSGHGFKHSAAIGEALAELATDGASTLDLSAFGWDRFRRRA